MKQKWIITLEADGALSGSAVRQIAADAFGVENAFRDVEVKGVDLPDIPVGKCDEDWYDKECPTPATHRWFHFGQFGHKVVSTYCDRHLELRKKRDVRFSGALSADVTIELLDPQ